MFYEGTYVYTVDEITEVITDRLVGDPALTDVWVSGEVADVKRRSEHLFFNLVGEKSRLRCIFFGRAFLNLREGEVVRVFGSIDVYEQGGYYDFVVQKLERLMGIGAYAEKVQALLNKIEKGEIKRTPRQLPEFPVRLAIVTSKDSAALRDILKTLKSAVYVELNLFPVKVHGEDAAQTISEALEKLSKEEYDAVIIARGGGASDDLWAFNDEKVIRKAVRIPSPLITGIGHQIDSVVLDRIADYPVHTPTAAAEVIVKRQIEFYRDVEAALDDVISMVGERVDALDEELSEGLKKVTESLNQRLYEITRDMFYTFRRIFDLSANVLTGFPEILRKSLIETERRLEDFEEELEDVIRDIFRNVRSLVERFEAEMNVTMRSVERLSPLSIMERGFALVLKNGRLVKSVLEISRGDTLTIVMKDGKVKVRSL